MACACVFVVWPPASNSTSFSIRASVKPVRNATKRRSAEPCRPCGAAARRSNLHLASWSRQFVLGLLHDRPFRAASPCPAWLQSPAWRRRLQRIIARPATCTSPGYVQKCMGPRISTEKTPPPGVVAVQRQRWSTASSGRGQGWLDARQELQRAVIEDPRLETRSQTAKPR